MTTPATKRGRGSVDSPEKNDNCVSCKKSARDDAIQCEMCGCWEHKQCAKVSDELYVLLDKVPDNVKFFCTPCSSLVPRVLKFYNDMSDCTKVVDEKISYLENKLSQGLTNITKQFSEQLKTIESKLADAPMAMDQETSQTQSKPVTVDTASKIVDEYRDKEMRKSNIIIFNIPEPKSMENAERKKEDIAVINANAEELGSTTLDIVDVVRLGAKSSDKNRPLKVHLNSLSQRRFLLMKAKELRQSKQFSSMYINSDLTYKERQASKELRQELARRKKAGEKDIFIRRGQIVKRISTTQDSGSNDSNT